MGIIITPGFCGKKRKAKAVRTKLKIKLLPPLSKKRANLYLFRFIRFILDLFIPVLQMDAIEIAICKILIHINGIKIHNCIQKRHKNFILNIFYTKND